MGVVEERYGLMYIQKYVVCLQIGRTSGIHWLLFLEEHKGVYMYGVFIAACKFSCCFFLEEYKRCIQNV